MRFSLEGRKELNRKRQTFPFAQLCQSKVNITLPIHQLKNRKKKKKTFICSKSESVHIISVYFVKKY